MISEMQFFAVFSLKLEKKTVTNTKQNVWLTCHAVLVGPLFKKHVTETTVFCEIVNLQIH